RRLLAESLGLFRELGSRRGIAECLDALAAVALAGGLAVRAARLWGAAEGLREATGATMWFADRIEYERHLARLHSVLDADTLAGAWSAGRALAFDRAIAESLLDSGM